MSAPKRPRQAMLSATDRARALLQKIHNKHGTDLIFYQSAGCCDGSIPLCVPAQDMPLSNTDLCIGDVDGTPFWISTDVLGLWPQLVFVLDADVGQGGAFSLDNGTGERFILRPPKFAQQAQQNLWEE